MAEIRFLLVHPADNSRRYSQVYSSRPFGWFTFKLVYLVTIPSLANCKKLKLIKFTSSQGSRHSYVFMHKMSTFMRH